MRLKNFNLSTGEQLFKALSEEARIRILVLLIRNKELTISDLEQILDFTQTKAARHLAYLKNSGIVTSKKRDQWVFYSLKDEVYDFVSQMLQYLNKDFVLEEDQMTFETLESNRELARNKVGKKWRA